MSGKGKRSANAASKASVPFCPYKHQAIAYFTVADPRAALRFYETAFGATTTVCMDGPGGSVMHAEFTIGDSTLMLSQESPSMGYYGPAHYGGSPVAMCVYVADVDRVFAKALKAGATQELAVRDQFYGDRSGTLKDPFGLRWTIATHVKEVTPAEMEAAKKAMEASGGGGGAAAAAPVCAPDCTDASCTGCAAPAPAKRAKTKRNTK